MNDYRRFVLVFCLLIAPMLQSQERPVFPLYSSPHSMFSERLKQLNQKRELTEQQKGQTYLPLLEKAAHLMLYSRIDLLVPLLDSLEAQLDPQQDQEVLLQTSVMRGYVSYYTGHYSIAQQHYEDAMAYYRQTASPTKLTDPEDIPYLTIRLYEGINFAYLQDYQRAIYQLTEVYEAANRNNLPRLASRALYYLGDVSYELKNYEEALVHYNEAIDASPPSDKVYLAELYMSKAQMTNVVGDRNEAMAILDQAIIQLQELNHLDGLAFAYLLKSYIYSKQDKPQLALDWIAKSVEIRELLGVEMDIANAYVHYSSNLATNNQLEKALSYAQKAADMSEQGEDLAGQWDAYHNLAKVLSQKGDFELAYSYMSKSERALLAKARLDITAEAARLNSEFNLSKKQMENRYLDEQKRILEQKNRLLETQLSLKELQQSRNTQLMVVLCVVIVLFLILSLIIYYLYRKSQFLATRDTLTELHNRRSILSLGELAFSSSKRYHHPLAVMMLDVDNFKQINDSFGHKFGDKVLQNVAQICRDSLRETDLVGRIGGEEFLFVLPQVSKEDAVALAQRVRKTIRLTANQELDELQEVTASIGIALYDKTMSELLELINYADIALYKAKREGRNKVMVFHSSMREEEPQDCPNEALHKPS